MFVTTGKYNRKAAIIMAVESMGIECLFMIGKSRRVKELCEIINISATGYNYFKIRRSMRL
jgi:hypothetical protein